MSNFLYMFEFLESTTYGIKMYKSQLETFFEVWISNSR